jgi:uncharacterized RDD family membrane protein YckC
VPGLGRRGLAFGLDLLLSAVLAGLFTAPALPGNWSLLAWVVLTVPTVAALGVTPGMSVCGLRVARVDGATFVGVPRAVLRTVLVFFVLPALVLNADRRSLHDQASGTVVIRTR